MTKSESGLIGNLHEKPKYHFHVSFDLALPEGALLEDGASDSEYFRCTLQLGWFSSFASRSAYAKKPWFETLNMTSKDDVLTAVEALIARWDAELPDHRE